MVIANEIKIIEKELDQHLIQVFKEDDVTPSQFQILLFLLDNQNRVITQKDIGKELESAHTTVIGLLKRMSEKGLVKIEVNRDNGKFKNVSLSENGMKLACKISNKKIFVDKKLLDGFSEKDIEALKEYLERLRVNIRKI